MNRSERRRRQPVLPEVGRIPGGCDDCNAYSSLTQPHKGVYLLSVFHDDTCPAQKRRGQ